MKKRNAFLPWIIGLALASLLMATLALGTSLRYLGSDDTPILRSFMGYEGGVPAHFNLYIHTVFARLLHALALAFPGVAWFSILQLFLLWFGAAVILKSMAQRALWQHRPLWLGAGCGLLFVLVFCAYPMARISYTTTAALLGAAAVAQLMGIPFSKASPGAVLRGMLLSIALLMACYCLRQINLVAPLAFWLLALATALWLTPPEAGPETRGSPLRMPQRRPVFLSLLIGLLGFAVLIGMRAVEIKAEGLGGYLAWQNARIRLFDYTSFVSDTDLSRLPEIGWTQGDFYLFGQWFFLDSAFSTNAMEQLYAMQPVVNVAPQEKLAGAVVLFREFFQAYPAYAYALALAVLLGVVGALYAFSRKNRLFALASLGGLLLGLAMLLYLGYEGRLPLRAAAAPLFPMGVFLFCLALTALPPKSRLFLPNIPAGIALALSLILCGVSVFHTGESLLRKTDEESQRRFDSIPASADAFALENPDVLMIYDITMVLDSRLFPDTSQGVPGNLLFWGGWPAQSPSWRYQLEQYGLDPDNLHAQDLLGENIVFASAVGKPHSALIAYMRDACGAEIDWDIYGEHGYVIYFQLYEAESEEDG